MREIPNFTLYLDHSESQLLHRLAIVQRDIALILQEIGICESEKWKARAKALIHSEGSSAATRTQEVEVATVTLVSTEVELRADYGTLLEEKFFIIRLLDAFNDNTNHNFN